MVKVYLNTCQFEKYIKGEDVSGYVGVVKEGSHWCHEVLVDRKQIEVTDTQNPFQIGVKIKEMRRENVELYLSDDII